MDQASVDDEERRQSSSQKRLGSFAIGVDEWCVDSFTGGLSHPRCKHSLAASLETSSMPVTPLHLGPGLLFKALGQRHVSLTMFAASQIAMDVEVLVRFFLGIRPLHGFTNTVVGATVVMLIAVPVGKPLCEWILRRWNLRLRSSQARWAVSERVSWGSCWLAGGLGVSSHVLLDAMMHGDARPWSPFLHSNSLVGWISLGWLHGGCLITFFLGGLWLVVCQLRRRARGSRGAGTSHHAVQHRGKN